MKGPAKNTAKYISFVVACAVVAVAVFFILQYANSLNTENTAHALTNIPTRRFLTAILATILSFFTLSIMEVLAARANIDKNFSAKEAGFFALIVYGISNSLGLAGLASTPLRLHLYSRKGLSADRIISTCLLSSFAFWMGLVSLLGTCLLLTLLQIEQSFNVSNTTIGAVGFSLIMLVILSCRLLAHRKLKVKTSFEVALPGFSVLLTQSLVAALDWLISGWALYALLPSQASPNFLKFLCGFLGSQVAALLSAVPGGVGIFESFNFYLVKTSVQLLPEFAAAYIAYRAIYYLFPLMLGLALLLTWRLRKHAQSFASAGSALLSSTRYGAPFVAALIFAILGLSFLFESTHLLSFGPEGLGLPPFAASVIGSGLLILAAGLYERGSSSKKISLVTILMILGYAFYNHRITTAPAAALGGCFLLLILCKNQFYRKTGFGSLLRGEMSIEWILYPVIALLGVSVMSFYFNGIKSQKWWAFAFDSDASAFLRGTIGAFAVLTFFSFWRLLSPVRRPVRSHESRPQINENLRGLVDASPYTTACLVLAGDKLIFSSEGIHAFIMYKISGPYWIAMGDPIASDVEHAKILRAYIKQADLHGGIPVFYQVRPENLSKFIEIGFQAAKIGEEAQVYLPEFSLEGRERKTMRNTCNRIEKDKYQFSLISADQVDSRLEELERVSNDWLQNLSMKEKRFSMGRFDKEYLCQCDLAIVSDENNEVVAFANLWSTNQKHEFSADLMRYRSDAPSGVMEYLLIQLMFHAKAADYTWFNLGMAPLSGLYSSSQTNRWHQVGDAIYRAGESFYNFRGLKAFKDKFSPTWESRFLIYPQAANLPKIMAYLAILINYGAHQNDANKDEKKSA